MSQMCFTPNPKVVTYSSLSVTVHLSIKSVLSSDINNEQ